MTVFATIADRNNLQGFWPAAEEGTHRSDFFSLRVFATAAGAERFAYLSPKSLLLLEPGDPTYLRRYYPWSGQRLLDALVDPEDQAYLLTTDQWLHRHSVPGPKGVSDWPGASVHLSDYMPATFQHVLVTEARGGCRVVACWGAHGALLLQVDEADLHVQSTLQVDADSGMLGGSAEITFLRMAGVVSLTSGQLLLGTRSPDGTTTELLIDLATRRPARIWTPETKLSQTVATGEILEVVEDGRGRPDAPVWDTPEASGPGLYTLTWHQRRPDLVSGYEVWCGVDAAPPMLYAVIPTGAIRRVSLQALEGHVYALTVRAQGSSAVSSFSEELRVEPAEEPPASTGPQVWVAGTTGAYSNRYLSLYDATTGEMLIDVPTDKNVAADGDLATAKVRLVNGYCWDGGSLYFTDEAANLASDTEAYLIRKLTRTSDTTCTIETLPLQLPDEHEEHRPPEMMGITRVGDYLYVTDRSYLVIWRVPITGGKLTRFAGIIDGAQPTYPLGLTSDRDGNLYVADYYHIGVKKVTPAGVVSNLWGGGECSPEGLDDITPDSLTQDAQGNLYLDGQHAGAGIQRLTLTGVVSEVYPVTATGPVTLNSGNAQALGYSPIDNCLYAAAGEAHGVHVFSLEGEHLRTILDGTQVNTLQAVPPFK